MLYSSSFFYYFFFNATATTEIYTLSLHDALPISHGTRLRTPGPHSAQITGYTLRACCSTSRIQTALDRKSTRLNSSHLGISYAVFCLKKKKQKQKRS